MGTDILPQADPIDEVAAEDWAEAIHFEQLNVQYFFDFDYEDDEAEEAG